MMDDVFVRTLAHQIRMCLGMYVSRLTQNVPFCGIFFNNNAVVFLFICGNTCEHAHLTHLRRVKSNKDQVYDSKH